MIFKDSFESIVEALYLSETLGKEIGRANIRVNPKNDRLGIDYTFNKTIIISDQYVEEETIKAYLKNENTIITRLKMYSNIPGVLVQPYITYINFKVMWNGEVLKCPEEIKNNSIEVFRWIGDFDCFECDSTKEIELYFPKITNLGHDAIYDKTENITSLGWLLHQVGINTDHNTRYKDLDLLKTKKL